MVNNNVWMVEMLLLADSVLFILVRKVKKNLTLKLA